VGQELALVLERVHSDHGETASIVGVDRIRSGGVAGFFAREEFEVLVEPTCHEVDGEPPAAADLDDPPPTVDEEPPPEVDEELPEVDDDPDGDRFADVLAQALETHDRVELALQQHAVPPTVPTPVPAEGVDEPAPRGSDGGGACFWARFESARADAELFHIPPVAVSAVVGSLPTALPVVRRCIASHWAGTCEVFALTGKAQVPGEPGWTVVERGSDLVRIVEQDGHDFPLLVIDVPGEPPLWVRPLLERLRRSDLGLVHYVLDGDPTDEDLATWHGELGRPAVLDLVSPLEPARVLGLLDRGEPIASIAGVPVTASLLLALRSEVAVGR
jgi:hypothetical protein